VLSHIHIRDCYVHDVNGTTLDDDPDGAKWHGGIHMHTHGGSDDKVRFHDLLLVGNTVEKTGGVGIGSDSDFIDVDSGDREYLWTDLYVAHNFIDDTDRNNVILRSCVDAVVEYNVFANSSRASTGHNLFNFHTVGFVAQYNEAYGNVGDDGFDRGGYDADYNAEDTTYQYNYSHDNMWCIGIMKKWNRGVVVRYNISQNDKDGFCFFGFENETDCHDVEIYNNVCYVGAHLPPNEFIAENRTPHNTIFANNIFYYENGGHFGSSAGNGQNTLYTHNAYYGIDAMSEDANAVTSNINMVDPGTGGYQIDMSDPNRLSGYRLQAGSSCINAGINMTGADQDFWGNPVPAGSTTDIGVHEVQP